MNKKECVMHELYDILEKLRYPEIARICFEEFENAILTGPKRINLLQWLLQNSPGFNNLSLNKLKDQTLEDKLLRCYSQIGLCSDINILQGKCDIDKQLHFFALLVLFIKNIYMQTTEEKKQIANISLKENNEIINKYSNNESLNINGESELNSIDVNEEVDSQKALTNEQSLEKSNLDKLNNDIEDELSELSELKIDNYEPVLQRFNAAFKELAFSKTQNAHSNSFLEVYNDLCTDIKNIHFTILTINKTLRNEDKMKNQQLPEILNQKSKIINPLTVAIKNNLVLNEQAQNMLNKNL